MCLFLADKICLGKLELNVMLTLKVNVRAKVNFVNEEVLKCSVVCRPW